MIIIIDRKNSPPWYQTPWTFRQTVNPLQQRLNCLINIKSIVAANRDEFFSRPTAPLTSYTVPEKVHLYCGRDLTFLGKSPNSINTWLGINDKGVVSAVTNCRLWPIYHGTECTRGELPLRILYHSSSEDIQREMQKVYAERYQYHGFNLIAIKYPDIWYVGSHYYIHEDPLQIPPRDTGNDDVDVVSISNGTIDSYWPKMRIGAQKIKDIMANARIHPDFNLEHALMEALTDSQPLERHEEMTTCEDEGEAILSPIFIKPSKGLHCYELSMTEESALFGTVSSALIFICEADDGSEDHVEFIETSWRNQSSELKPLDYYQQNCIRQRFTLEKSCN